MALLVLRLLRGGGGPEIVNPVRTAISALVVKLVRRPVTAGVNPDNDMFVIAALIDRDPAISCGPIKGSCAAAGAFCIEPWIAMVEGSHFCGKRPQQRRRK
jgi:hypothetical protein